ncbi:MAG TPA: AI-2E family transporter [Polyangia bacterium]|nr:AI-2E family transporter [Polyangia bacterium]
MASPFVRPEPPREPVQHIHIHLPAGTIMKVLLAVFSVWAAIRLWPEFVLMLVALLIAVALQPLVSRLERGRLSRGAIIGLMGAALIVIGVLVVSFVFTSLADEVGRLISDFPSFRQRVEARLPDRYPSVKKAVGDFFGLLSSPDVTAQSKRALDWGTTAVSGGMAVFFTLILTLYFLLDGRRLYAWLLAYVPRRHRDKMATTVHEVSAVVCAYVRGQVVTSVLFSVFVAIVLSVLRVPAAAPLALLAGFCDVIPVVGIIIATVPATLLALTVSPMAALAVLCLYVAYHLVETYFIVPKIYGQRLRLSTLAVLLALVAGSTLAGLIGAVLILPVVAAYPIVERIWLAKYLSHEVIKDHNALAKSAGSDNQVDAEVAVENVLQGQKHAWEGATGNLTGSWMTSEPVVTRK